MSFDMLPEIKTDIKEIKSHVLELVKQGAVHNTILLEHEKRSTSLETRIKPLETDLMFRSKVSKIALALGGLISGLVALMQFLRK